MKSYLKILMLLIVVVAIASCNKKIYFTAEVRNKVESKNIDLKKLQYFVDNDVLFSREISSNTARVSAGNIVFQNGKYYQTVSLRGNTKGVCTAVYPDKLTLSFESGNNKNIVFTIPKSLGSYDVYQMVDADVYGNATGTITYDGQLYNLVVKNGYLPRLMIRKRLVEREGGSERTMKGLKVK